VLPTNRANACAFRMAHKAGVAGDSHYPSSLFTGCRRIVLSLDGPTRLRRESTMTTPDAGSVLLPTKSIKKGSNLGGRAIRIFAMREVPYIWKGRKIQVFEGLAKTIRPVVRE
jgi:hypothetical protein